MKRKNKMKVCNTCGFENSDSAEFCQNCFSKLEKSSVLTSADNRPKTENEQIVCDNCFQVVPSSQSVCQNCGNPVSKQKQTGYTAPVVSSKINNGSVAVKLMERNRFSTLAGMLFLLASIVKGYNLFELLYYDDNSYIYGSIFFLLIYISISVSLILGSKPSVLTITAIWVIYILYNDLQNFYVNSAMHNIYEILCIIALLLSVFAIVISLYSKKKITQCICVLSVFILFVAYAINWVTNGYFHYITSFFRYGTNSAIAYPAVSISWLVLSMIMNVFVIGGFLFSSLWLSTCNYLKE